MKTSTSILFFLAVFGAIFASPIDKSSEEDWSIEDLHHLKRQTLSRAEKLIEEALTEMGEEYCREANVDIKEPLQQVMARVKAIDTEKQTVCALVNDQIEYVFEPLTKAVDDCGKASRLGPVATSIVKTIKSVFHYVCSINGEQILELINPCLETIDIEHSKCGKDFEAKFDALSPETSTGTFVEAVCEIVPNAKTCMIEQIEQHCTLDITKNTWAGLIDAVLVACH